MTRRIVGLVDRMAPFPQLVYNGVFAMNPFTRTVNFTAQVERAARPFFLVFPNRKSSAC